MVERSEKEIFAARFEMLPETAKTIEHAQNYLKEGQLSGFLTRMQSRWDFMQKGTERVSIGGVEYDMKKGASEAYPEMSFYSETDSKRSTLTITVEDKSASRIRQVNYLLNGIEDGVSKTSVFTQIDLVNGLRISQDIKNVDNSKQVICIDEKSPKIAEVSVEDKDGQTIPLLKIRPDEVIISSVEGEIREDHQTHVKSVDTKIGRRFYLSSDELLSNLIITILSLKPVDFSIPPQR